jgi:pimeloyl-ACP methyl ester carboxylesterase
VRFVSAVGREAASRSRSTSSLFLERADAQEIKRSASDQCPRDEDRSKAWVQGDHHDSGNHGPRHHDRCRNPHRADIPEEALTDLRRRIVATRLPTKELVEDRSQGVQLATMRELARYWTTEYDWRKFEARLNTLPQFTTAIDGVEIHFILVRSRHENALPLIMTHGWPGSVIELLETIGPLTDPTKYGGTPGDAFHLVLPSLPGYGFSGVPTELGWDSGRIARAWATAGAPRLHALRRPGGRRGRRHHGRDGAPSGQGVARHPPQLARGGVGHRRSTAGQIRTGTRGAQRARDVQDERLRLLPGAVHPATDDRLLPAGFTVGLAAWLLDHDTDSYYKISHAFVDGKPVGSLTRESIVDNITLYWLTGTVASAARWYWEFGQALAAPRAAGEARPAVAVPVGFTTFPGEIWAAPRSWVETVYPSLAYFNEVDRGGHFAAWEEPKLFAAELRAVLSSHQSGKGST